MKQLNSDSKSVSFTTSPEDITQCLQKAYAGDEHAYAMVFQVIYHELRRIAKSIRFNFFGLDTLNTTAIVHEAYIKLSHAEKNWESRTHYYSVAAKAMRQVLLNAAREKKAAKRGDGIKIEQIEDSKEVLILSDATSDKLINFNDLLVQLEEKDKIYGRIVECRFFAGLSIKETAEVVNLSQATVKRKWQMARDWLFVQIPKDRSA
jgi:RNA polymerase sigma factor (TIGR02999 family)